MPNILIFAILALLVVFGLFLIGFSVIVYRQQDQIKKQKQQLQRLHRNLDAVQSTATPAVKAPSVDQSTSKARDIALPAVQQVTSEVKVEPAHSNSAVSYSPKEIENSPTIPSVNTELVITEEFKHGLELLDGDASCIFVTGKAGTGKSRLLTHFVETTKKAVALLAPTGMAALKINGQTIHSFFGFPPRLLSEEDIKPSSKRELYRALDMIVIDEISMVRTDILDAIDMFLRLNGKDRTKPFGGTQMVFFGDLYQLPPVVGDEDESKYISANYDGKFFFNARVMKEIRLEKLELSKVFRQKDEDFITALNAVRVNDMDQEILDYINERHAPARSKDRNEFVTLVTINQTAEMINSQELGRIVQPMFTYRAKMEGEFTKETWKKRLPADLELNLKVNAQVIFIKNDVEKRWYNGSRGRIIELKENYMKAEVDTDDGKFECEIVPETWEIRRYKFDVSTFKIKSEVVGTFVQYPLRLGWAITIHKSQGSTLERVHIDMGAGAFDAGQAYVALSRCKSLEGLTLERPLTFADVKSNDAVVRFMSSEFPAVKKTAAQPTQVFNQAASHTPEKKSRGARRPFAEKGEEELKYGSNRDDKLDWFVNETVDLILPLLFENDIYVDLRKYRGECKVYVNGDYSWTAAISDELSAQALWKAVRSKSDYVSIQPLNKYDMVRLRPLAPRNH